MKRNDVLRLIALAAVVLLEGFAMLSVVLNIAFLPLATIYPNVISVVVLLLPILVGLLTQRFEAAVLLALLPFLVLAVVYSAIYAPVWTLDLLQIGVLVGRVAGVSYVVGGLAIVGWLLRRIIVGKTISALSR
jgi:hypothetical protein